MARRGRKPDEIGQAELVDITHRIGLTPARTLHGPVDTPPRPAASTSPSAPAKSSPLMTVLGDLYESEINCTISSFWDCGYTVKLGDELNGYVAEATFREVGDIEPWLVAKAIEHFRNSVFGIAYRHKISMEDASRIYRDYAGDPARQDAAASLLKSN